MYNPQQLNDIQTYILKNGYRGSNGYSDYDNSSAMDRYYVTQLAMYHSTGEYQITKPGRHSLYQAALDLYNEAVAASRRGTVTETVSMGKATGEPTETSDGKAFQSTLITVYGNPSITFNVSVSARYGVYIVNEAGTRVSRVNGGSKIRIVVPKTGIPNNATFTATVSVNAAVTEGAAYAYTPTQKYIQRMSIYTEETKTISSNIDYRFDNLVICDYNIDVKIPNNCSISQDGYIRDINKWECIFASSKQSNKEIEEH